MPERNNTLEFNLAYHPCVKHHLRICQRQINSSAGPEANLFGALKIRRILSNIATFIWYSAILCGNLNASNVLSWSFRFFAFFFCWMDKIHMSCDKRKQVLISIRCLRLMNCSISNRNTFTLIPMTLQNCAFHSSNKF